VVLEDARAAGALDLCRTGEVAEEPEESARDDAQAAICACRVEALLKESRLVRQTGDDVLAEKALHSAEDIDPQNGEIAIGFAKFHYGNARYHEAENHIRKAQLLLPNRPEPHNIMAKIWIMRDELDKAIKEFSTAIAIDPSHANSRLNIAKNFPVHSVLVDGSRCCSKLTLRPILFRCAVVLAEARRHGRALTVSDLRQAAWSWSADLG
jgi:Flp pilus assembly protein TadD